MYWTKVLLTPSPLMILCTVANSNLNFFSKAMKSDTVLVQNLAKNYTFGIHIYLGYKEIRPLWYFNEKTRKRQFQYVK